MVLEALLQGLKVFTYWETYVAALLYVAILAAVIVPTIVIPTYRNDEISGPVGCLAMVLLPAANVLGIAVFVLTMSPILLQLSSDAAWSYPWDLVEAAPWRTAKALGTLLLIGLGAAFIPYFGRWISFYIGVVGSVALAAVVAITVQEHPEAFHSRPVYWPGFWTFVGMSMVGGAAAAIGTACALFIRTIVDSAAEWLGELVFYSASALFGFIPVFMYGAYLAKQLT